MTAIKSLPPFQRPREKLYDRGADALKDYELLAILLRTGFKGKSALEVAKHLLNLYSLQDITNMSIQQLASIKGIGPSRASIILSGFYLYQRVTQANSIITIQTPEDVFKVTYHLSTKSKEHLHVLYLNARNQLITQETVSIGTTTASISHPREVFCPAIIHNAVQIIMVHNHPSGDPTPSASDLQITKQLQQAGQIIGIEVIDHIIISKQNYYSMKSKGDL